MMDGLETTDEDDSNNQCKGIGLDFLSIVGARIDPSLSGGSVFRSIDRLGSVSISLILIS